MHYSIVTCAVSPLDPSVGGLLYQDPGFTVETPTVETPTSITSSTSNYCLDFNLQDHVVSIRKPQAALRYAIDPYSLPLALVQIIYYCVIEK